MIESEIATANVQIVLLSGLYTHSFAPVSFAISYRQLYYDFIFLFSVQR